MLDTALVVTFPGPNSFTGEDCAELSLHGGRAVLAAVSEALIEAGARPAEPGEFSRRAHLNGRLDLLEAEAMADLIAAETEAQRRLAVEGAGALQESCARWREELRQVMAQQEALIDFPDEDLPPEVEARLLGAHRRTGRGNARRPGGRAGGGAAARGAGIRHSRGPRMPASRR